MSIPCQGKEHKSESNYKKLCRDGIKLKVRGSDLPLAFHAAEPMPELGKPHVHLIRTTGCGFKSKEHACDGLVQREGPGGWSLRKVRGRPSRAFGVNPSRRVYLSELSRELVTETSLKAA